MVLRNVLEEYWREEHRKAGYQEIKTPIILNEELWHRSGHWDHYKENMYFTKIDEADFAIKPMNCPEACWYTRESFIPTGFASEAGGAWSGAQARAFRSFARLNEG